MYNFVFTIHSDKGTKVYNVKAKDKQEAIRKGLDKAKKWSEKTQAVLNPHWECKMKRSFI